MNISRTVVSTIAVAGLTLGAVTIAAPMAGATPATTSSTCTAQQRVDLKSTITDLHAKISAQKLTPEARADRKAVRREAVAALKAQARAEAGSTQLTTEQRADLKAKIQALIDADKQASAARHATIDELKTEIAAARTALRACHA